MRNLLAATLAALLLAAPACGDNQLADPAADADAPSRGQLAADLRAHLVDHYAAHGDAIAAAGGRDLAAAQAAVDPAAFAPADAAADPHAHDPGAAWVFQHPDVTVPGSSSAFFVAYDIATRALIEVYGLSD